MKVLLDLNVIIDLVLDRAPFADDAKRSVALVLNDRILSYLTSLSIVTLYYVVSRNSTRQQARLAVQRCLATFGIVPVSQSALEAAFALDGPDFEDDVQAAAAHEANMDAIVTRDTTGFVRSPVLAISPADLLARMP